MSLNDSFIEEVTEEVRRDRIYKYGRRYGWIAILIIVLIVFGAAFNEWRKAQTEVTAQLAGDALAEVILSSGQENLEPIKLFVLEKKPGWSLASLKLAHVLFLNGNIEEAISYCEEVSEAKDLPIAIKDLALLYKYSYGELGEKKKLTILNELSGPDRPYRLLAIENKIAHFIAENSTERALSEIKLLNAEPGTSPNFRRRIRDIEEVLSLRADLN